MDLKGLLLGRCPRCGQGAFFKPGLAGVLGVMNDACPVCGLRFLREGGYFLGAMYVSYGLGVATVLPIAVVLVIVLHWPLVAMLVMIVQTLVSVPLFLRYSRISWLYLDQSIDPR